MAGRGLGLPLSYPCRAVRTILIISAVGPLNNYHNNGWKIVNLAYRSYHTTENGYFVSPQHISPFL